MSNAAGADSVVAARMSPSTMARFVPDRTIWQKFSLTGRRVRPPADPTRSVRSRGDHSCGRTLRGNCENWRRAPRDLPIYDDPSARVYLRLPGSAARGCGLMDFLPEAAGPHDPVLVTVERLPGSIRRTTNIDTTRPNGLRADAEVDGAST